MSKHIDAFTPRVGQKKQYHLPNDISRCTGRNGSMQCPIKHTCLRYRAGQDQNDMNAVVPFMAAPVTDGDCSMYIPQGGDDENSNM
jgi:hypothetical protein